MSQRVSILLFASSFAWLAAAAAAEPGPKLVSMPVFGPPPDAGSSQASVSATGRFVAFASAASNFGPLVNGQVQILVGDRKLDKFEVVSVSSGGTPANGWCGEPQISSDARYVLFVSLASNLVPFDTNGLADVFRHDRLTHQTVRASIGILGQSANAEACDARMSSNGRFVVFTSAATNLMIQAVNGTRQVYLRDLLLSTTRLASVCNGVIADKNCRSPAVTNDGRYVVFESRSPALAGESSSSFGESSSSFGGAAGVFEEMRQVFLADLLLGTTTMASVAANGAPANGDSFTPAINPSGRFIAFTSRATNLVKGDKNAAIDLFVLDRKKSKMRRLVAETMPAAAGDCFRPSLSKNGRAVACEVEELFAGPLRQVYRFDLASGMGVRVSNSGAGNAANGSCERPSIAANGRFIAFHTAAPNLTKGAVDVGVFLVKD